MSALTLQRLIISGLDAEQKTAMSISKARTGSLNVGLHVKVPQYGQKAWF